MRSRFALVLAAVTGLAACQGDDVTPAASSAATPGSVQENLLTLVGEQGMDPDQRDRLDRIRGRGISPRVNVARAGNAPEQLLRQGSTLRVGVAPGVQVVAVGERVQRRAADDISWAGRVRGAEGWVQMVLSEEGMTGTVTIGTEAYSIEPLGNGLHAVSKLDQSKLPPEHPADHPAGSLDAPPPSSSISAMQSPAGNIGIAAVSTINVLVVYTASAASAAGGITSKIQLAVDLSLIHI